MKKTAIVTGSSRGIGRAIAARLAREGARVCINYKERHDAAEEILDILSSEGCEVMKYCADVSDAAAVHDMVCAVREKFGDIDILVNNAGIAGQIQFQDLTAESWGRYFAVNVNGAFNCTHEVLPDMLRRHSGAILNISSIWGLRGASCEVAYSSTKGALIALTRSLAMELAPTNIRVNCIAPGVINTDMVQVLGQDVLAELAEQTPLGRLGTAEDIAAAAAFLLSDEASFITGQILTSDGGFIL